MSETESVLATLSLLRARFFEVLALLCTASISCSSFSAPSVAEYKIENVRGFLFLSHEGKLSENIIDNPKFASGSLWNTPIGAGSVGSPANSMLIVLEISGPAESFDPNRKVNVVVREGNRKRITSNMTIGTVGKGGISIPVWVANIGCRPLSIEAYLEGQRISFRVEKTINFSCGE